MSNPTTVLRVVLISLLATACALAVPARAEAQAKMTDQQELEAIIMEYTRLEDAGDMATQSKMIAPDRWWHGAGGRRTDNGLWMKAQALGFENSQKRYPGVVYMREARDIKIRMVAPTVAVASFTWFTNRVIPADLPADKVQALGPPAVPQIQSHVWVKQADGWKLVSSHISPEYVR